MKPVVVIGVSHHNTLGVIRALGRKGLSSVMYPIIAGRKNNYVSKSKYIVRSNLTIIDDISSLLDALNALKFPTNERAVVICCWDDAISLLDANRSLLNDKYIIPEAIGKFGGIHSLMDKSLQIQAAKESGLSVPKSFRYTKNITAETVLNEWDKFPCIIKPANSTSGSKTEIHIINDNGTLKNVLRSAVCESFFIQPFIKKAMEFQLIGCSLSNGEEIVIPGYTRIIRQPDNTNTGYLKYQPLDEAISQNTLTNVGKFLKNIGYSGLFSIEFLKGEDGEDYFLEINMRNDGNAICVTDAGVNLPFIWYAYNSGIDYKNEVEKKCTSLFCMPEFNDIVFVLKGKLSLFKWIKDVRHTSSFMEYSSDDKKPFYKRLASFILFLIKRFIKGLWSKLKV